MAIVLWTNQNTFFRENISCRCSYNRILSDIVVPSKVYSALVGVDAFEAGWGPEGS
jgi:hypothetical protein